MRALVVVAVLLAGTTARAERPMCGAGARYRGVPIDLDVKNADIHDLFRLLADTGRVNIVVSDRVTGRVTLRLKRVPWDQVACTVAATQQLSITIDRNVVLVVPAAATATR